MFIVTDLVRRGMVRIVIAASTDVDFSDPNIKKKLMNKVRQHASV